MLDDLGGSQCTLAPVTAPATIERLLSVAYHSATDPASDATVEQTDRGTWIVKGLKVFKAGTFKDSMGVQRTWEPEHLQQMVFHYELLKGRDILPNVPVRADHWSGVNGIVGYFNKMYADQSFLFGDIEITEPTAYEKWARGTYRSRSLEVGYYETNDEAVYWPVVMGLAFVDLPAVEGLHSRATGHNKESGMGTEGTQGGGTPGTTQPSGADAGTQQPGTGAEGQQGAGAAATGDGQAQGGQPPANGAAAGGVSTPPAGGQPAAHGAAQVISFSVNGQPCTDPVRVQQHITALETAMTEQRDAARDEFVNALAHGNKIAATQIESLQKFAKSLSDEQYKTWQESWGVTPPSSLFGQHGNGVSNPGGDAGQGPSDVEVAAETVANHLRANMAHEKIKLTPSYKRLVAAQPDHPVLSSIL